MKHSYRISAAAILFLVLALSANTARSGVAAPERNGSQGTVESYAFVENRGQVCDTDGRPVREIAYVASTDGMRVFITPTRISYVVARLGSEPMPASGDTRTPSLMKSLSTLRVDMELVGANPSARIRTEGALDGTLNYYTPSAPDGILGLRMYGTIVCENVYENIDLVYHSEEGRLKYDFVVRPGGRVSDIRLRYVGTDGVIAATDGAMRIATPLGELHEGAPETFVRGGNPLARGDKMNVRSSFNIAGNDVTFSVDAFDPASTLVIDPTLQWSTYYGGSNFEYGQAVATDLAGNVVTAGYTFSINFPTTPGALQTTNAGLQDAFVVKFDGGGTRLWATYFGGRNNDPANAVATDALGNVYVAGLTESTNLPVQGASQPVNAGQTDGWLLKLTPTGTRLWATYLGGAADDIINGLSVDPAGTAVIVGTTSSTNLATTPGVLQPAFGGYTDAFLTRFTPTGTPVWTTYCGGSNEESGEDVTFDLSGNIVFTGATLSQNFPVTNGAVQAQLNGSNDAYLVKLTGAGAMIWGTYFGGNSFEAARALTLDPSNAIAITGITGSTNLPVTPGAYRPFSAGGEDAFVAKFTSTGALRWATYYGGALSDEAFGIGADLLGRIAIAGQTASPNFPTSSGAIQTSRHGMSDAFVVKFDSTGNRLWATYLGGGSDDAALSLACQYSGNVLLSGWSFSNDFPTTAGAFQTNKAGSFDAIVVKLCDVKPLITVSRSTNLCPTDSVVLDAGPGYSTWFWSTGESTQSIKVGTAGSYWVRVTDGIGCTGYSDTIFVNVAAPLVANAGPDIEVCDGTSAVIGAAATGGALPLRYHWSPGAGLSDSLIAQPSASPDSTTLYTLTITDAYGCFDTDDVLVTVLPNPTVDAGVNDTICAGTSKVIGNPAAGGTGAFAYDWSPATGLSDAATAQPSASPLVTTTYRVTVTDAKGCVAIDSVTLTVDQVKLMAGDDRSICQGDSILIGAPATGGMGAMTYTWAPATGLSSTTTATPLASPGATQSYVVIATDGRGCMAIDTVVVHVFNSFKALAGEDVEICTGSWAVIGDTAVCGRAPYVYSWTPAVGLSDTSIAHPIANPAVTTSYTLSVMDADSNVVTDIVTVIVNSPPVANAGPDTVRICGNNSAVIGAAPSGGTGTYSFAWSPAAGLDDPSLQSPTASSLTSTWYTVRVTDSKGCSGVDSTFVEVSDLTAIAGNDIQICAGDSTTIGQDATGGTGPYTYAWSPTTGLGTPDAAVTFAKPASTTTYVVTATDFIGCTATDTVTVIVLPPLFAHAGNDTTVCRADKIFIGAPATGGTPPYRYSWTPSTDLSSNRVERPIATPMSSRSYVVTVTDAHNCVSRDTVNVYVGPWPLITAGNDTTICRGDSIRLGFAPPIGAPFTYAWTPSYGMNDTTIAQPKVSPFYSTTYRFTVTDTLTGCMTSDTVTITSTTPALAPITVFGPTILCPGDSVWLDADTGRVFSGYLWNTGDTTRRIKVGTAGTYQAQINTRTHCPGITPTVQILVANAPEPLVNIRGSQTFCEGGSVTLSIDSSRFASIRWSNGARTGSITIRNSGTYYVDVTSLVGCPARSNSYTITVLPRPQPVITASAPTTLCSGDSLVLSADPGFVSYLWSTGATTPNIVVRDSGSYFVTVLDINGCSGTSLTRTVSLVPKPQPVITANGPLSFCVGGTVRLDAGAGFASYAWSTGQTTRTINVAESGTVTCTVTTANGCTGTTPPVMITVNPLPHPVVTVLGDETICDGDSTVLDAGAGFRSYYWSTGETTRMITVKLPSSYTVSVVDTNGCTAMSAGKTITVRPRPTPVITANGPLTFCVGDSVVLDAGDHVSWVWSNGARTRRITVREGGTFNVRVGNEYGCEAVSAPVTVTRVDPPEPVISAGGPLSFCQGGSVVLDAGAGYTTYEWSTGARTRRLTVMQSGTYNVRVTNSTGCRGESPFVNVVVFPLPSAPIIAQVGQSIASTPAAAYQWKLAGVPISGATSRVYTPRQSGIYTVTITDVNGCTATSAPFSFTLVDVEQPASVTEFQLYPDPNDGHVMLDITLTSPVRVRLSVMNLLGQQLVELDEGVTAAVRRELDLRALTPGLYFLHVTTGDQTMIRKIIRR